MLNLLLLQPIAHPKHIGHTSHILAKTTMLVAAATEHRSRTALLEPAVWPS
jgi:hypothetical protein